MNKKRFLLAIIFVAIFFCLSPGKIIAQSPLLFNDHLTPMNPKEGEEVNFSIRIRLNTQDGCGHSYESAPAPPYNNMLVDFGDGHISTLSCIPSKTATASQIYECSGTFYHSYGNPGDYTVKMKARYGLKSCPEWSEISFPIKVGDSTSPPPPLLCGNGAIDAGEDCDGSELAGKSCQDFNDSSGKKYASGSLACHPLGHKNQCRFDTSGCVSTSPPAPPPLPTGYDDPLIWDSIVQFILYFTNFIFNICLGLSVLMILIGAFVMVAGGGNPLKREKAKKIIIWALIGFSVALISQGIFQLFKLIFGVKDF